MKKYITRIMALGVLVIASLAASAQTADFFPLPKLPDDNMNLRERCNFMVYNFWKECPVKQSFSSLARLNDSFGQWAGLMPYASADTVHMAIDAYIASVEKQSPKNIADVARMAEHWFYTDSAEIFSEELYTPFCRAAAKGKKVPSAEKARYQAQLQLLENSGLGVNAPAFPFEMADGTKSDFGQVLASRIILYFNDPDCLDCSLAKARLSADYNLNSLIDAGLVKVLCIYPGEATDEWRQSAERYPDNWVVGAAEDIDLTFDIPKLPTFYYLDGRHKILGKHLDVETLLYLLQQINLQKQ